MIAKMMAAVVAAGLTVGCKSVEYSWPMPSEHIHYVAHPLSAPMELPPVPPDGPQVAGAPKVRLEFCLISMTPAFQKEMGITDKLGRKLSREECDQLVHAAEASEETIVISSPHLEDRAGKTQVIELTTTGTYVSDYTCQSGVWVPTLCNYEPSSIHCRAKAAVEGEAVVLTNVTVICLETYLLGCSGVFHFPEREHVIQAQVIWHEPVRNTWSLVLDKELRLKSNEGVLMEMSGTEERGYAGLCRALSDVKEWTAGGIRIERKLIGRILHMFARRQPEPTLFTYLLIMPPVVVADSQEGIPGS